MVSGWVGFGGQEVVEDWHWLFSNIYLWFGVSMMRVK
jgi:hypothetical protein